MTLSRSHLEVTHRSVGVLMPDINVIKDQFWIQKQRHTCAFGSSGPDLPVPDDFSKFFIISFIFIKRHLKGDLPLVGTWARTSSSSGLFLQQRGAIEEFGAAEELAEAPEAIEMPTVLWHVARCTGAEDLVGAAEDFGGAGEG